MTDPQFQQLNRWLIEVQSILNSQGQIDPDNVVGLPTAYNQVGDNTVDIQTLFAAVQAQSTAINANTANIATNTANIAALAAALAARNQVYNDVVAPNNALGIVGDWYARTDVGNKHIYVKTAVATWTLIV